MHSFKCPLCGTRIEVTNDYQAEPEVTCWSCDTVMLINPDTMAVEKTIETGV